MQIRYEKFGMQFTSLFGDRVGPGSSDSVRETVDEVGNGEEEEKGEADADENEPHSAAFPGRFRLFLLSFVLGHSVSIEGVFSGNKVVLPRDRAFHDTEE